LAEIFLHGLGIEPASDLLGCCDGELAAGDFEETPALKFVLEQLALGLGAFQDGIRVTERIRKGRVSKVVKAAWGYGRDVVSLGHLMNSLAWVRAGAEVDASPRLANLIYVVYALVNTAYALLLRKNAAP
jgi:hypothetical protein